MLGLAVGVVQGPVVRLRLVATAPRLLLVLAPAVAAVALVRVHPQHRPVVQVASMVAVAGRVHLVATILALAVRGALVS